MCKNIFRQLACASVFFGAATAAAGNTHVFVNQGSDLLNRAVTLRNANGGINLVTITTSGSVRDTGTLTNRSGVSSSLFSNIGGLAFDEGSQRLFAVTDRGSGATNYMLEIDPYQNNIVRASALLMNSGIASYRDPGFAIVNGVGFLSAADGSITNDPLFRVNLLTGATSFISQIDGTEDVSGLGARNGVLFGIDHGEDRVATILTNGDKIDEERIRDGDIRQSAGAAFIGNRYFAVSQGSFYELIGNLRDDPDLRFRGSLGFNSDNLAAINAIPSPGPATIGVAFSGMMLHRRRR